MIDFMPEIIKIANTPVDRLPLMVNEISTKEGWDFFRGKIDKKYDCISREYVRKLAADQEEEGQISDWSMCDDEEDPDKFFLYYTEHRGTFTRATLTFKTHNTRRGVRVA